MSKVRVNNLKSPSEVNPPQPSIKNISCGNLKVRTTLSSNNIYNINKKIKIIYYIGCDDLEVRINSFDPKGMLACKSNRSHDSPLLLLTPLARTGGYFFPQVKLQSAIMLTRHDKL